MPTVSLHSCHLFPEDKMNSSSTYDRYQRQLILKGFGKEAQDKLSSASVLVIGAGGLGCPVLQYLVAAGVGHIGIADDDVVSLSNLHRQVLYTMEDIGQPKVFAAKKRLQQINDAVDIKIWNERWGQQHCIKFFNEYDIIVDATDNFSSRYMINDACVLMVKTLVFGAVSQYEGQVAVFNHRSFDGTHSTNYRDLFPTPPKNGEVLNCSEAGVLGMLPGVIGAMQATEVVKLIAGIGKPLVDTLLTYNALSNQVYELKLQKQSGSDGYMPKSIDAFLTMDYPAHCESTREDIFELDIIEWQKQQSDLMLVDIREANELPKLNGLSHIVMPLSNLDKHIHEMTGNNLVFVCKSGRRSLQAVMMFNEKNISGKAYSLKGGVDAMLKYQIIQGS